MFLALQLGMTLKQLRKVMDNSEFQAWTVYFGRQWQREELAALRARQRR